MDLRDPAEEPVLNASDITIEHLRHAAVTALQMVQTSGAEQRREFAFSESGARVLVTFVAVVRDGQLVLDFGSTAYNAGRLARRVGYRLEEILGRAHVSLPTGFLWRLPQDFLLPELPSPPELIELKGEIYGEVRLGALLRIWLHDFSESPRVLGSRDVYTDTYEDIGGHVTCSMVLTEFSPADLSSAVRAQLEGREPRRAIHIQLRASLEGISVLATFMDVERFAANHELLGHGWEDESRTVLTCVVVR